jgi:hypothetical protein
MLERRCLLDAIPQNLPLPQREFVIPIQFPRGINPVRIMKQLAPQPLLHSRQAQRRIDIPLRTGIVSVIRGFEQVAVAVGAFIAKEVLHRGVCA